MKQNSTDKGHTLSISANCCMRSLLVKGTKGSSPPMVSWEGFMFATGATATLFWSRMETVKSGRNKGIRRLVDLQSGQGQTGVFK